MTAASIFMAAELIFITALAVFMTVVHFICISAAHTFFIRTVLMAAAHNACGNLHPYAHI